MPLFEKQKEPLDYDLLSVGLESKPKRKIVKLKMIMSGPITLTKYLFSKSIAMEQRWDLVIPRLGDQLSDALPKHFVSGTSR